MPLIILGMIVLIGGCLLIYYQFGPAISRRIGIGGESVRAGSKRAENSVADGGLDAGIRRAENAERAEDSDGKEDGDTDGKVLFLFGSGRREERPLSQKPPKLFAIADPHLSITSDKPMDVFGDAWKDHAAKLSASWRAEVGANDTVVVAGDISWALKSDDAVSDLAFLHGLPGKKILVRGNHDLWWQGITKLNAMYEDLRFLQNDSVLFEIPQAANTRAAGENATRRVRICGSRGWTLPGLDDYNADDEKILTRELTRMKLSLDAAMKDGADEIIVAMHFPPALAPQNVSSFTELFAKYPIIQVVYGHLHGAAAFRKGVKGVHGGIRYDLVSCDYLDFKPLRIL